MIGNDRQKPSSNGGISFSFASGNRETGVSVANGESQGMAEEKQGRGRPSLPYPSKVTRVIDVPTVFAFLDAFQEAVRLAFKRAESAGRERDFVYMWKDTAGTWHVAEEFESLGEDLAADTSGVLMAWSSGEIGIAHHGRAVFPPPGQEDMMPVALVGTLLKFGQAVEESSEQMLQEWRLLKRRAQKITGEEESEPG